MSDKKFVIESDGTVMGTKITVNGNRIHGASSVVFEAHLIDREVDFKIRFNEKEEAQKTNKIGF